MSAPAVEYLFITRDYLVDIEGEITALGASTRLGSVAPVRALMQLGYDARAYSVATDPAPTEALIPAAKRIVFGEMASADEGWGETVAEYRRLLALVPDARGRVVFSIADDHFDDPEFLAFYRDVLPGCLAVTVVSPRLAERVRGLTARPVHVAPEPCEGARGAPQAFVARRPPGPFGWLARRIGLPEDLWRVRLLWFGYPTNLPPLLAMLPELEALAREHPLQLTCATQPVFEIMDLLTPERSGGAAPFQLRFVQWSPNLMDGLIAASDIVLIPSEYRDPVKQAKSPNRLVAGLHGGRFVVAHPLPAYAPYAQFAWVGEDLLEGLRWAIRHPRQVLERIARGQACVDQRHSPETVARFWLDVLNPKN
jgi:hypothetical protein